MTLTLTPTNVAWIGLGIAIVVIVTGFVYLSRNIYRRTTSSNKVSLFSWNVPNSLRLKLMFIVIPEYMMFGLSWPFSYLVVFWLIIFGHRKGIWQSGKSFETNIIASARSYEGPAYIYLTSALFALLLVCILYEYNIARTPLLFWLFALWLAWIFMLCRMLFFSELSFHSLANIDLKNRSYNIAFLFFLFVLIVPISSSIIFLIYTKELLSFENIQQSIVKIMNLRGIVWEGPKNTFAVIKEDYNESFYVITGLLLYTCVISKLLSLIKDRISDKHYLTTTYFNLMQGRPERAIEHLNKIEKNDISVIDCRAIAWVMANKYEQALKLVLKNIPNLSEYSSDIRITANCYLIELTMRWEKDATFIIWMLEDYINYGPKEEDLVVNYFYLMTLSEESDFVRNVDYHFLSYAKKRNYYYFEFFYHSQSLAQFDPELLTQLDPGIIERIKNLGNIINRQCTLNGSLQLFADALLSQVFILQDPSKREAIMNSFIIQTNLVSKFTKTLTERGLLLFSLEIAKLLLSEEDMENIQIIQGIEQKFIDEILLLSNGARFIKLLAEARKSFIKGVLEGNKKLEGLRF